MVDVVTDHKGSREVKVKAAEEKAVEIIKSVVNMAEEDAKRSNLKFGILFITLIVLFLSFAYFLYAAGFKSKKIWLEMGRRGGCRQVQLEAIERRYGIDGANGFEWVEVIESDDFSL